MRQEDLGRFLPVVSLRQNFLVSIAASLVATAIASGVSALTRAGSSRFVLLLIVTIGVVSGLVVFAGLMWRRQMRLQRDVERLERSSWPDYLRDVGDAAAGAGIEVHRDGGYLHFKSPTGVRHLAVAEPPSPLGQVLERDKTLRVLADWGVPMRHGSRGQLIPAQSEASPATAVGPGLPS